jgi:hypothetical protein
VFAGVTGGTSIGHYERMVGKHPAVFETFMTWNTPTSWLTYPGGAFRARLALHLSTAPGYGKPGVISPMGIALGWSDRFLISLGSDLAKSRRIVYLRLMAEMNGHWNPYSAFAGDGSPRGGDHSARFYILAWRRTVLILRGGPVALINRRLRVLRLPPVRAGPRSRLPGPRITFLWVPQTAGSPDLSANGPGSFWPGSAYVDWVGTDFYASSPNFAALERFYRTFPGKPFVISEWALWGADSPEFVRSLFGWARAHSRVRMLLYYQGFHVAEPFDLVHYPLSQAALRGELRSGRYLAYPPEYAHPPTERARHAKRPAGRRPPPEKPPLPPVMGTPPAPPAPLLQLPLPIHVPPLL